MKLSTIASMLALSAALTAQGMQDRPRVAHAPTSAAEPVALAGADAPDDTSLGLAQAAARRAQRRASPIHTAEADGGADYGIWAAGAEYKVSFHDGMTFVPYLGRDYPHNQPFAWTTRSVRVGETELLHASADRLHAQRGDFRYEYDLGEVTEAYDVLAQGLEQTFVIDRRPAGPSGDLVVEGVIRSQMRANSRKATHGPVDFFDASGERIFTYGAAFAIDANGVKVPMSTGYADGVLTLSLAARALETLAFPVTVDPLLGNVSLRTGGDLGPQMDCVREDEQTSDNLWYAYTRYSSATDQDLYVWRVGDQWAGADVAVYDDITSSWSTGEPAIAVVAGADKVVTAFSREFGSGQSALRWHTHAFADLSMGVAVGARVGPGTESVWRPDIGGISSFGSNTTAVLVFQRDDAVPLANTATSRVVAAALDVSGAGQGALGSDVVLGSSGNLDFERPRITQQALAGASPEWGVVFQVYANGVPGDDWDVGFRAVDDTAQPTSGTSYTEPNSADHKLGPVIAGQDGRYAVMYATSPIASVNFKTGLTTGHDLRVRRVDHDGAGNVTWGSNLSSLSELNLTTASRRWVPGGIAFDTDSDSHWMVTFASTGTQTAFCALAGYRGGFVTRNTIRASLAGDVVLGGVSYDDDANEFVLQVGDTDDGSGDAVLGDVWQYPLGSPEVSSGTSSSAATLFWSARGSVAQHQHMIGHEFGRVGVNGAPAGALHFMVMSLGMRDSIVGSAGVAPGTRLLVDALGANYLGTLDFRVGDSVDWDLSIPEFLAADTIYFQDWIFDGVAFSSTQRMAVEIVE